MSARSAAPLRVFLDSGVILEGCYRAWGASKGVLILAAQRRSDFRIVLAEAIEREVRRDIALTTAAMPLEHATTVLKGFEGWLARVQIERIPMPAEEMILAAYPTIMPALRHENDLPAVVTALQARPDWVLSTNAKHWSAELGQRIGLRIVTPQRFLEQLRL